MGYENFHVSYGGSVPFAVYLTVQRRSDLLWFRPADGTFTARTQGDSPVPYRNVLTNTGGDSWVWTVPPVVDLPATEVEDTYFVNYYNQLTNPATDSDDLLVSEEVGWNGTTVVDLSLWIGVWWSSNDVRIFLGDFNADAYADLNGDNGPDAGAYTQSGKFGVVDVIAELGGTPTVTPGTWGAELVKQAGVVFNAWWLQVKRPIAGVELSTLDKLKAAMVARLNRIRDEGLEIDGLTVGTADDLIVNAPSVARADGTAVDATDLAWQRTRERLVNADGWGWVN
jgi:hypothetical protein